jgi:hypothetical protein
MTTKLEQILQDVQALSPEDQQQLCRLLAETLPTFQAVAPATEATFQQQLVVAGLLREIKRSAATQVSSARRPRVTVQGKPLSATVIEERR